MLPTNDGVVVSSILYFHPGSLGKISNLTKTFQMGWFNHQLDEDDFAFGTTETIGIFAFYGFRGVCARWAQKTSYKWSDMGPL